MNVTSDDDHRPIIDPEASVRLEPGLFLAWCVGPEGEPAAWLLEDHAAAGTGSASATAAPHEQEGPLPDEFRDRVEQTVPETAPRCRAPRRDDGQPCRARVRRHGDRCHWHRPPDELEQLLAIDHPTGDEAVAERGRRSAAERRRRLDRLDPRISADLEETARQTFPPGARVPWQLLTLRMVVILEEHQEHDHGA